jgi:hypothetical protein
MGIDWSGPCNAALHRPNEEKFAIIYSCHLFVVVFFFVTAAVSGTLALWYARLDVSQKSSIWACYGSLALLACVGSLFGCVAWFARLQDTLYGIKALAMDSNDSQALKYRLYAASRLWGAVFYILYPVEFFCCCFAKLLVFQRMLDFISKSLSEQHKKLILIGRRFVLAVVVIGNFVLGGSLIAAAVYYIRIATYYFNASDAYDSGDVDTAISYLNDTFTAYDLGDQSLSVQNASESFILVIIVTMFAIGGLLVLRQLRNLIGVIDSVHGAHDELSNFGRSLHRKIITTVVVVFLTFIVRASFALMLSVGDSAPLNSGCGRCDSCQSQVHNSTPVLSTFLFFSFVFKSLTQHGLNFISQNSILSSFLFLSPEVRTSVIFVSSPFSLLVVLWGMTSSRMKDMMLKKRRQVGVASMDGTSLLTGSRNSSALRLGWGNRVSSC